MTKDVNGEGEEQGGAVKALVVMFESLPEELQEAVFEIVADFFHLARTAREPNGERTGVPESERSREKD